RRDRGAHLGLPHPWTSSFEASATRPCSLRRSRWPPVSLMRSRAWSVAMSKAKRTGQAFRRRRSAAYPTRWWLVVGSLCALTGERSITREARGDSSAQWAFKSAILSALRQKIGHPRAAPGPARLHQLEVRNVTAHERLGAIVIEIVFIALLEQRVEPLGHGL